VVERPEASTAIIDIMKEPPTPVVIVPPEAPGSM
jgi:hypothetical protein